MCFTPYMSDNIEAEIIYSFIKCRLPILEYYGSCRLFGRGVDKIYSVLMDQNGIKCDGGISEQDMDEE